jgi:hypothetical protein
MAETRKLAAILAADVVGYSRLAGSDEERTATGFEHQQAGARAGREPTIRGCIAWKPSQPRLRAASAGADCSASPVGLGRVCSTVSVTADNKTGKDSSDLLFIMSPPIAD